MPAGVPGRPGERGSGASTVVRPDRLDRRRNLLELRVRSGEVAALGRELDHAREQEHARRRVVGPRVGERGERALDGREGLRPAAEREPGARQAGMGVRVAGRRGDGRGDGLLEPLCGGHVISGLEGREPEGELRPEDEVGVAAGMCVLEQREQLLAGRRARRRRAMVARVAAVRRSSSRSAGVRSTPDSRCSGVTPSLRAIARIARTDGLRVAASSRET